MSTDKLNFINIVSTFGANIDTCKLWSVVYHDVLDAKGNPLDILTWLFKQWNDFSYLLNYFSQHQNELNNNFWKGMSVEDAVIKANKEVTQLQAELKSIVLNRYEEDFALRKVFIQLERNEFALNASTEKFRKSKFGDYPPILRLYAIELEEGHHIITGGDIKLTKTMNIKERNRLLKVQQFLKSEGFYKGEIYP